MNRLVIAAIAVACSVPLSGCFEGPPGKDGKDGVDGKNGTNGTNGINGTNGLDGKNGTDGLPGAPGTVLHRAATYQAGSVICPNNEIMIVAYCTVSGGGYQSAVINPPHIAQCNPGQTPLGFCANVP